MHLEGLFIRMMNFGTHKLQLVKTWLNNLYKMLTYLILPIILGGHQGPIPHYTEETNSPRRTFRRMMNFGTRKLHINSYKTRPFFSLIICAHMLFRSDENCRKNEFFEFQVLTHPWQISGWLQYWDTVKPLSWTNCRKKIGSLQLI